MALWRGNPGHRSFRNDRERSEPSRPLQKVRKEFAHMQSSFFLCHWNGIGFQSHLEMTMMNMIPSGLLF